MDIGRREAECAAVLLASLDNAVSNPPVAKDVGCHFGLAGHQGLTDGRGGGLGT